VEVHDYHAGKVDWLAHRLPVEGEDPEPPTAGQFAREDVVRCGLDERVGELRERIERSAYGFALVVAGGGVLLGRLRGSALDCDPALRVEQVMEPGPSTVRPHKAAGELAKRLAQQDLHWAIVTDPEGRLIGLTSREDLEPT
jgi:CBS domain-containing protein